MVDRLRIGGALVIGGVISALIAGIIVAIDVANFQTRAGSGYAIVATSLFLLGIGLALVSTHASGVFPWIWARRGLMTLGAGLLFDAVLVALATLPALSGSMADVLILPLIPAIWITVTGFGLTVIGVLFSGGRCRPVGWILVAAVAGLGVAGRFSSDALRPIGVGLGVVAALILAAGIAGIGIVAILGVQPQPDIPPTTS
jgi:hypothetical protein